MSDKKKGFGIFGGSFDPPHQGHVQISKISLKKINLKKIYWVITRHNPFKKKPFFSLDERIRKSKDILKKNKKIKVLYLDEKLKSTRTIQTINYFFYKKKHKKLYLIIGSDTLLNFHKWKSWKKIVKLVKLIVFSRKGYDRKGMKSIVVKKFKNKIIFIKNKHITISSTQIKNQRNIK